MNNKLLYAIVTFILSAVIFTAFATVVKAEGFNLFCSKKQTMTVVLKNEIKIDAAKDKISKIPQIKIIKIQDRDAEWSRMVNKMDLPKMDNPFKNEFTVKLKRNANISEIYNQIKEMDFVENVIYADKSENDSK